MATATPSVHTQRTSGECGASPSLFCRTTALHVVIEIVVVAKDHVVAVVAVVLGEGALRAQEGEGGGHGGVLVLERELALLGVALGDGDDDLALDRSRGARQYVARLLVGDQALHVERRLGDLAAD